MSRRLVAAVLAILALATTPTAQRSGQPALAPGLAVPSGIIVGTVIDARSGEPVPGVRVTRWLVDAGDLTQHETITDAEGRFLYHGVAAGTWRLVADLDGRHGRFGARRHFGPDRLLAVTEAGLAADVSIRLFESVGFISGRVTDDLDEPAVGVLVGALRWHPWLENAAGNPVLTPYWDTTRTDDRGRYRLPVERGRYVIHVPAAPILSAPAGSAPATEPSSADLPAGPALQLGDYRLLAADPETRASRTGPPSAPALDDTGRLLVYPAALAAAAAGGAAVPMIEITGGDEHANVDVRLTPARERRVTGRVTGPDGPLPGVWVEAMPATIDGTPVVIDDPIAAAVTAADGAFVLFGVPPGDYTLRVFHSNLGTRSAGLSTVRPAVATGGAAVAAAGTRITPAPAREDGRALWAELPLRIADDDVDGLHVRAARGAHVAGRIVFETDAAPPDAARISRASASLDAGRPMPPGRIRRADEDGSFFTAEYPPGRYLVRSLLSGWVMKSAMHRGRDLALTPFELGAESLDDVVVTMTDRVASVTGRVNGNMQTTPAEATVLIFRADYDLRRAFSSIPGTWKAERVEPDGSFAATDLVAGDYLAVAIDDADVDVDWPSARALDRLAPLATAITLAEGQTTNVVLDVRVLR